ncbi:MAG: DUF5055 domain-containing protein [Oscillospiraceae bacterium]|nr:DUF5055 domain-containing protein [Oscillospiraceae bacterium]
MAKQLTFEYKGREYVLEYTRDSVRQMERGGFVADDFAAKPMTVLPQLFAGAFLAHHGNVKREKIDTIYGLMKDKKKLIQALTDMYNDTLETLLEEPEEEAGNVSWTPNWDPEE